MEDINAMFSDLLVEIDLITKSLSEETVPPESLSSTHEETNYFMNYTDLNDSLYELEDTDLDALMADLVADLNATEMKLAADMQGLKQPSPPPPDLPPPPQGLSPSSYLLTRFPSITSDQHQQQC
ncbi:hypothetical protein CgunFtcFv8_015590 [Champsocephalus gunnari]|uniref:Uncharacterized protein n=1 Tax=Champsocephalus gunnari TaxID=52237 RepID=A0AAN8H3G1_CHAGU|nr:hypothetical protein CgunFtcFv8_015590 [Champsocephalus gunnari]